MKKVLFGIFDWAAPCILILSGALWILSLFANYVIEAPRWAPSRAAPDIVDATWPDEQLQIHLLKGAILIDVDGPEGVGMAGMDPQPRSLAERLRVWHLISTQTIAPWYGNVSYKGVSGSPLAWPRFRILLPYWIPFALSAVVCSTQWIYKKTRRTQRNGICYKCGYDLRATPERCPECGNVPKSRK